MGNQEEEKKEIASEPTCSDHCDVAIDDKELPLVDTGVD